jgi:hypothetical protein
VLLRELRFWGQAVLVCSLPLAFIYKLAGFLGFPNPLSHIAPGTPHASLGVAQAAFLGLVATFFFMRLMDRVAYGLAELLISLMSFRIFYEQLNTNYTPETFLLTAGGTVYLAVRGLDNIVTGAKQHYADPTSDPRWLF